MQSEIQIQQQIVKTENRNKFLRQNIENMRAALNQDYNNMQSPHIQFITDDKKLLKKLTAIENHISLAQKQLNQLENSSYTLQDAIIQIHKLETQLIQLQENKKILSSQVNQLRKSIQLKQFHSKQKSIKIIDRFNTQDYQHQIKVLSKKLEDLQSKKKMPLVLTKQRSTSIKIQNEQMQQTIDNKTNRLNLQQQIALYQNAVQSYEKRMKSLAEELIVLQQNNTIRQSEIKRMDLQINQWIQKIEVLKSGISHKDYRHYKK